MNSNAILGQHITVTVGDCKMNTAHNLLYHFFSSSF